MENEEEIILESNEVKEINPTQEFFPIPPEENSVNEKEISHSSCEKTISILKELAEEGNAIFNPFLPPEEKKYPLKMEAANKSPILYKTKLCSTIFVRGVCQYKQKCIFAHSAEELRCKFGMKCRDDYCYLSHYRTVEANLGAGFKQAVARGKMKPEAGVNHYSPY